ncbi:hypothetical protein FB451DRAFT_1178095 [Mycena latifolia]|nr:hypothetical protein FB451DRAFT_1178095 [Mycena latifolia]
MFHLALLTLALYPIAIGVLLQIGVDTLTHRSNWNSAAALLLHAAAVVFLSAGVRAVTNLGHICDNLWFFTSAVVPHVRPPVEIKVEHCFWSSTRRKYHTGLCATVK